MPTSVRKYCEAAIIFRCSVFEFHFICPDADRSQFSKPECRLLGSPVRDSVPDRNGSSPHARRSGFLQNQRPGRCKHLCVFQSGRLNITGPASSSVTWGNITGTLTNQTDLNTALSGKAGVSISTRPQILPVVLYPLRAWDRVQPMQLQFSMETTYFAHCRPERAALPGLAQVHPLPRAAGLVSGAVNVTCGTPCVVNGFSFANFGGQISGFPANTTYSAYVYADNGVVKYGFPSGTTAPSTCASVTCVSGISAMPVGASIFPIAVVTLNNGTVAAVVDARNAGVSQPDIIVAGAGLSSARSGSTVTISNSVINGVSLFTGTSATLTPANIYQLVRCNNAAGCTLTLPQAGGNSGLVNGTYFWVKNDSTAGIVTITPVTSKIDNSATYTLSPGQSVMVWSDGTNYLVAPGKSVSSGGSGGATVVARMARFSTTMPDPWVVLLRMRQTASLHLTAPGS